MRVLHDKAGRVNVIPSVARDRPARSCRYLYVYILASKTCRLYVGVTNNLPRRIWEHRAGVVPGFTRRYAIRRLVYFEQFEKAEPAIRREKQIKAYARVKKLALVESLNPEWDDIAEHWFADVHQADPSLRSG